MNAARRSAGRVPLAARALLPALGAAALVGTVVAPASAAPIPVACSEAALNSAITTANSGGGTLVLFPGCTYTLTAPLPTISANVVIDGRVATITRSATAPDFGILRVNNTGNLDIRNIIISNGAATASGDFGGGIRNDGTLRVSQSIIKNNRAQFSGGIGNNSGATTTVVGSLITKNTALHNGGGLANDGTMVINQSTISDNTAAERGGGVANDGTLQITQSVLNGNAANGPTGIGGGIANFGSAAASTTLTRTIVTGNRATTTAGGVYNNTGTVTSTASVIAHNTPNNCVTSSPAVPQCLN
ncbi:hypothetical protein ABZW32_13755 [Streptomyces sp. NPDC004667]|uniref:hypothetical protein n=1 Tax=Streptomyces sp. NPDC004667 TaxID=3154285 RepID=UPI00339F43C7